MERWKESQLKRLSMTTDIETAYEISLGFAKNIGYKFFAFSTTCRTQNGSLKTVRLNNYPVEFESDYVEKQSRDIDPVVAHCNQTTMPILWQEELFSSSPWLWDALEYQGMQHGWSQSVHDESSDLCSILSLARSHCPVSALELYENLGYSIFMGRHLHDLIAPTLPQLAPRPPPPHLSQREIDVLKLAADGKTAGESAVILNVTARTINFHVQKAIEKFRVNNKLSAVIAAAKAGYFPG
ncbi:LuxR family transcriptional regulator [Pseudomonas sp. PB120]|uniref:helix-turn-helix transcriptional regulator n=1 Tax=Pseudomonas sp. PB120 TaxID=2494700 RepID=UPI0012FDC864|nr:LuxR family transcriptional regulator [Pseudomonas sp. PB120]MVV50138.1 LuxR family transcriptional regulator [Pseudomonas sp. PB120]